ncbi:MAG: flavodoxin [Chloroflexota bacterium]
MKKVGLFYGSNTGNTELDAELIKKKFEERFPNSVDLFNIGEVETKKMEEYDYLIVGSPTWNIGELQDDWMLKFSELDDLNMKGKLVAMFGVGDQFGYPDNYVDAIGIIGRKLEERGADLCNFTDASEYEFENSLGVEDGVFLGMALDDDNQNNLTDERVDMWVFHLYYEFGFLTYEGELQPRF